MRAGRMDKQITIQGLVTTAPESIGEPKKVYATKAEVWASITPLSSKETFAGQATNSEVTHEIRIRYLSGVLHSDRILYGVRIFDIESIINTMEMNKELIMQCVERL
jgi:SPP1 family predicted phage head-tail adaptor